MKKLRLLVSLMTRENDYQLEQAASAQQAAAGLGCDLQVIFADNDAITQGTQLLKIIQAAPATHPDAIICEPVGGPCLPQVARAAVQAGIPWVLLNRDADYLQEIRKSAPKLPIFTISADQKEVGRIQGQQLAALVRDGAGVLHIQGPSENVAAKDRTTGMQMTLTPGVPVVTLRGQWTEESAQRSVESWLRLNTSQKITIGAVGAQNDAMAMGARKAFSGMDNLSEQRSLVAPSFRRLRRCAEDGSNLGTYRFAGRDGDHPADRGPRHNDHAPGPANWGEASGPGIHDARIVSACRTAGTDVGKVCCLTCLPVADKN